MDDEEAKKQYNLLIASGTWNKKAYPAPPYYYPEEISIPEQMCNLPDALMARGYSESDIKKLLGENYIRVLKEVWR